MAQIMQNGIPSKLVHPLMSFSFRRVAESKLNFEIQNFINPKIGRGYLSESVHFNEINGHWSIIMKILKKDENDNYHLSLRFMILPKLVKSDLRFTVKAEVIICGKDVIKTQNYYLEKPLITDDFLFIIKNNVQTIPFNVKVSLSCNSNEQNYIDMNAINKQILSNNINMLNDSTYSDFVFIVEGKEFKVHKNILAAASSVFVKIFNSNMQESIENKCIVNDIASDTFKDMLRFIYGGILPDNIEDVSMSLYEAAHYYNIKNLMDICKQLIRVKLSAANAQDMYVWAELYDVEDLKTDALKQLNIVDSSFSPEAIVKLMKRKEKELMVLKRLAVSAKPVK